MSAEPEPPPPPPKAKPKCESIDEKCSAEDSTRVDIGQASVHPPTGWTYAKENDGVVSIAPNEDAALAFGAAESGEPDKLIAALTPLLDRLKVSNVKLPALKPRFKKPQSSVPADGLNVGLWEVDKAKMNDAPGTLLILVAPSPVGDAKQVVVGVGFAKKDADQSRVGSIMDAVKTVRGAK